MSSTEKRINYSGGTKAKASLIPVDVWFEILSLLPVKTLLVLRAVCKSFLSITSDPNFVSIHLRRRPNNNHRETRFLTLQPSLNSYQVYEISTHHNSALPLYSNNTLSPMPTISGQITLNTDKNWSLAGSLDGLLLLLSTPKVDIKGPRTAVLWNPSVRRHRQLSFPSRAKLRHAGLGYHNNDYKVIAMACTENVAWVYSVKAGSWTKILNSGFRKRSTYRSGYSQSLSFKGGGGVLWMERRDLVWFDFGTEKFRYIEMTPSLIDDDPIRISGYDYHAGLVMLDGGSSVGVWSTTSPAGCKPFEVGVWALETDTLSWSRRYTRKLLPLALVGCEITCIVRLEQCDGELVFKYWQGRGGGEEKYFRVFTYDQETLSIKLVHDCLRLRGDYMGAYFESLIIP